MLTLDVTVADSIHTVLSKRLRSKVTVVPTANKSRLVSFRRRRGETEVRISRRLMALGDEVVEPVVDFVCEQRGARQRLRDLYSKLPPSITQPRPRPIMAPRGDVHDLAAILRQESMRVFGETVPVDITWGPRRRSRRTQRTIRLGAYHFEQQYIRVHRRLDHSKVPAWFVGFVVFHELLHHRFGTETRGGRRVLHSRAFRAAEADHPRFHDALQWEAKELPKLLRGRGAWGREC